MLFELELVRHAVMASVNPARWQLRDRQLRFHIARPFAERDLLLLRPAARLL